MSLFSHFDPLEERAPQNKRRKPALADTASFGRTGRFRHGPTPEEAQAFDRKAVWEQEPEVAHPGEPADRLRFDWQRDRHPAPAQQRLSGPIGAHKANDRLDVAKLETALHNLGAFSLFKTAGPTGYFGGLTDEAIRDTQSALGVKVDGIVNPNGETWQAIQGTLDRPMPKTPHFPTIGDFRLPEILSPGLIHEPHYPDSDRHIGQPLGPAYDISGNVPAQAMQPLATNAAIVDGDRRGTIGRRLLHYASAGTQTGQNDIATTSSQSSQSGGSVGISQTDATSQATDKSVPIINQSQDRKRSILDDTPSRFEVKPNPKADNSEHLHEISWANEVGENDALIEAEAKRQGLDPNFVRAIVYMETSRGWYDRFTGLVKPPKSLRPMNVNVEYWKELGYTREQLEDPETNIKAGTTLLKRISDRMPGASIEAIASVYHNLATEQVTDYGARVRHIYDNQLWQEEEWEAPYLNP